MTDDQEKDALAADRDDAIRKFTRAVAAAVDEYDGGLEDVRARYDRQIAAAFFEVAPVTGFAQDAQLEAEISRIRLAVSEVVADWAHGTPDAPTPRDLIEAVVWPPGYAPSEPGSATPRRVVDNPQA